MSEPKYEVRYMCDREGELLASDLSYLEAQSFVRDMAEDMHEEQVADLVIREDINPGILLDEWYVEAGEGVYWCEHHVGGEEGWITDEADFDTLVEASKRCKELNAEKSYYKTVDPDHADRTASMREAEFGYAF